MENEIFIGLVYNTALLLVLSIIYNSIFIPNEKNVLWKHVLIGVVIGLIGIALMLTPVKLVPGVFFDTRSILISVAAMYFGLIPTVSAVVIICAVRIIIGGDGALMGVLVTVSTAAIGYLWHEFRLKYVMSKNRYIYFEFYFVGVIVHIAMLLCMFALPHEKMFTVFSQMWFRVLLLYPIGSLLLSLILYSGLKNNRIRLALIDSENNYKALYYENQNKQSLLKALMDSVPDLIFYKDRNGIYLGSNAAFGKFLGKDENEIIGRTDAELFTRERAQSFTDVYNEIIEPGTPYKHDFISLYPDGTEVHFETLKTSYCDKNGTVLGVIGISRDITERKKKEEEIIYLTHHDGLTGLYNRTYFDERTAEINIEENLPLSVIIGDINGLKLFNDAFGHSEGDKLLIEVAKILMSCVRPEDIVARTGGDEFGILLPRTDNKTAQNVVEKIKNVCERYSASASKETYYASISLGYATKSICEESIDKVIKSAEEAMYRRKLLEHKSLHSSIISSIKTTLYEKSHETEKHAERLAGLSKKLGSILGLSDKEMDELELLSMLHDIGKIGIEDSILTKADSLTDDEWRDMKKHPEIGYRIAMASPELKHIAEYILCHHERWDGKGYPQGLSGNEIPILSRILSVVDSYDAMTNDRVYRKAVTKEQAITEILNNAETQFDPEIAKLFVNKVL
ncbi:MAG: diguanylate cyclase [Oscillospiraceae bacterium]